MPYIVCPSPTKPIGIVGVAPARRKKRKYVLFHDRDYLIKIFNQNPGPLYIINIFNQTAGRPAQKLNYLINGRPAAGRAES